MNNSIKIWIQRCVRILDEMINNPAMPGNSVEDLEKIIKDHYKHLTEIEKSVIDYNDFLNTVKLAFKEEPPATNIKEPEIGGWLDQAQRGFNNFHWLSYKELLIEQGKSGMIPLLNSDTFAVLDSCVDPKNPGDWDRRGLVYGHVQSGKTANYIGLINRAFDAGYRIIIVFTGMTEDLRQQTQDRINEGVIGRDENNKPYGVGKQRAQERIIKGTTKYIDFSNSNLPIQISNLSLKSKIVFVVKKNVAILNNMIKWLRKKSEEQRNNTNKIINTPFLIIDDEADNASINSLTQKEKDADDYNLKSINRNIRIILSLIDQKSFVAYTATPYSIVLQRSEDIERSWEIDGYPYSIDKNSDLFPQHFIIPIREGKKYFGVNRVFGNEEEDELSAVIKIDQDSRFHDNVLPGGGYFTSGRNTVYDFDLIPDSLQIAIIHFITVIIVRNFRGHRDHNTMLIHTSHEVYKIDFLADKVSQFLKNVTDQLLHSKEALLEKFNYELRLIQSNSTNPIYKKYFAPDPPYLSPYELNLKDIIETLQSIDVISLHSKKNDPYLRHHNHKLTYDKRKFKNYIVIGGNRLSRGLTIEGLSTSYFVRQSTRKDSLYQMGRWFGYRIGFEDCVQIFSNSDQYEWFRDIMLLENKLRDDLMKMREFEMTPSNWEIKVARSNMFNSLNNKINITDPNKLRHTKEKKMDFGGLSIRTKYFERNNQIQKDNMNHVLSLIDDLKEYRMKQGDDRYPQENNNINFKDVPTYKIMTFLSGFNFEGRQKNDFDDLRSFLDKYGSNLNSFSVSIKKIKSSCERYPHPDICPVVRVDKATDSPYYEIDALLDEDKDHTFDIINSENVKEYEECKSKSKLRYDLRNSLKKAIMVVYPVIGKMENKKEDIVFPAIYFAIPKIGNEINVITRE